MRRLTKINSSIAGLENHNDVGTVLIKTVLILTAVIMLFVA